MNQDNDLQKGKREYRAPALTRISLRPEEAVLGHCKNSSNSGPVGANCTVTGCSVIGS